MKRRIPQTVRTVLVALAVFISSPPASAAETTVYESGIDDMTGGDYRLGGREPYGAYGSCFSVVPQASPKYLGPEVEIGPDFFSDAPEQYDNLCTLAMIQDADPRSDYYHGWWEDGPQSQSGCYAAWKANTGATDAAPVDPYRTVSQVAFVESLQYIPNREAIDGVPIDQAVCITEFGVPITTTVLDTFDFSFFSSDVTNPLSAFAWSFKKSNGDGVVDDFEMVETWNTVSAPSQYNACLSDGKEEDVTLGGTFDDEIDDWDPLSGELYLGGNNGGDGLIAFYFLTEAGRNTCQVQSWELFVDEGSGEEVNPLASSDDVGSPGVVKEFAEGKYLWFDLKGIPLGSTFRLAVSEVDEAGCQNPNSSLSAIYVSGTNACNLTCADAIDKRTLAGGTEIEDLGPVEDGASITWQYLLRNTNAVPVTFTLSDDPEGDSIDCGGIDTLEAAGDPDEKDEVVCSLDTGKKADFANQPVYQNTATVTFTAEEDPLQSVECTADSGYVVIQTPPDPPVCALPENPDAKAVRKTTLAGDPLQPIPDGASVEVGTPIGWRYVVTNYNAFDVSFVLTDSKNSVVTTCPTNTLVAGADTTCEVSGFDATLGAYSNEASVIFAAPDGSALPDAPVCKDESNYVGVNPTGTQGCTPGYWKQKQHYFAWTDPYEPVDPVTLFNDVFSCDAGVFDGKTLLGALKQGGGGLMALGRHAVAALLNSASGDVDYPSNVPSVISAVNGACATGNASVIEALKDELDEANNLGCPLGNGKSLPGNAKKKKKK